MKVWEGKFLSSEKKLLYWGTRSMDTPLLCAWSR